MRLFVFSIGFLLCAVTLFVNEAHTMNPYSWSIAGIGFFAMLFVFASFVGECIKK